MPPHGPTTAVNPDNDNGDNNHDDNDLITIIGFGSLLSERSSRLTFPNLKNFRLGRVPKYRRVFGHPASIFFQRKLANMTTLEISSLSVEYVSDDYRGFLAAIFEVPNNNRIAFHGNEVVPSRAFLEREEEFDIVTVPYEEWNETTPRKQQMGVICRRSSDENYLERWGADHFYKQFGQYGVSTIWNWSRDSGMRPCAVYFRHCYLAAQSMGQECLDSFLDDTYLIDRSTTVREYIAKYPAVLETQPPPELLERYSG